MVHNGIEYGDMQLIGEAYGLLQQGLGMEAGELAEVFSGWNRGKLDSYLIEISGHIFAVKDEDGEPLVEKILDSAGQKGTGKWTAVSALELGIPLTLIGEAVFARFLSSLKEERVAAAKVLSGPEGQFDGDRQGFMPRRSSLTPKATCSCGPPPRPTAGTSTTAGSRSCGAAAALSGRRFWARSAKPLTTTPSFITSSWRLTSRSK
jgi:6-phosphogluconate dehydrogenase